MAKIIILSVLSFVLCNMFVVEGRALNLQKRDLSKDKAVREMMSLLNVRKRLHSLEESTRQLAPVSDQPLSKIDEQVDVQDGGGVTHTQLCSDAVSFLQSGSETIEKRDLVINYVFNYCIKPSGSDYDIAEILNALTGQSNELDGLMNNNDWPNWPGFGSNTSPVPVQTTVDYWQQLYDKLFENDDNTSTEMPSTTTDWWEAFFDELFNELDESETTTVMSTMTSAASSTYYFDLEAAFGEFWNMIEQEQEDDDVTNPKGSSTVTPVTTPAASSTESSEPDDVLQDLLDLLTEQEAGEEEAGEEAGEEEAEDNDVTTPRRTTMMPSSSTTESSDVWNMVEDDDDETDQDAIMTVNDQQDNGENDVNNDLPPIDVNKRKEIKKRLLNLLAESLLEKRRQQMRK